MKKGDRSNQINETDRFEYKLEDRISKHSKFYLKIIQNHAKMKQIERRRLQHEDNQHKIR